MPKLPYDMRVKVFAEYLVELGAVTGPMSIACAYGIIDCLRRWCWKNMTDELGTATDIAGIVHWKDHPFELSARLVDAGLVGHNEKVYYLPSALREASEYLRHRWLHSNPESHTIAMQRADPPVIETQDVTLWGDPIKPKPKKKKGGYNEQHQIVTLYWCQKWHEEYRNKYPFTVTDGKHIKRLCATCKETDKAKEVIDAFFQTDDKFIRTRAHKLGCLITDLPRFITAADNRSRAEFRYKGTDEDLIL